VQTNYLERTTVTNMKKLLLLILFALPIFAQMYAKLPAATTCNVAGDRMTDDTAAIQTCINAAPDDSEVVFPSGVLMKITATLHVDGRYGWVIYSRPNGCFRWTERRDTGTNVLLGRP
jgi:polygalacturonase